MARFDPENSLVLNYTLFYRFSILCDGYVCVKLLEENLKEQDDYGNNEVVDRQVQLRSSSINSNCECQVFHNNNVMCRHVCLAYEELNDDDRRSLDWMIYHRYFVSHDIENDRPATEVLFSNAPHSPMPTSPESANVAHFDMDHDYAQCRKTEKSV